MGKAISTGQGGMCKVKLYQAVKLHSSLQHVMTAVAVWSTSSSDRAKCSRQSRGSRGHLYPAPAVPPFYSCSPSGSCSQKPLSEGRRLFTFVPIKKIKESSKIVIVLVWQNPHSSNFLKPCDFHPSAGSQQWVCSLQPRVKNRPENSWFVFLAVPATFSFFLWYF